MEDGVQIMPPFLIMRKRNYLKTLASGMLALMFLGSIASAEEFTEDGYSKTYETCTLNAGGVTSSMLECAEAELKLQDRLLNAAYKKAMASLNAEQKKQLKEGQRAFLKMRDADTALLATLTGGSIDTLNSNLTFLRYTVERVGYLQSLTEQ